MTVQPAAPARAQRECDECHVVDDLGHHQTVIKDEGGLSVVSRHFACCAASGTCPDGSCAAQTGATPGV